MNECCKETLDKLLDWIKLERDRIINEGPTPKGYLYIDVYNEVIEMIKIHDPKYVKMINDKLKKGAI